MEINNPPTIINDASDIERLNHLFDQLLEKPFLSPTVAINAVRAAMDYHGLLLPKLDVETQVEGPNTLDALSYLMSGKRLPVPALDCEYLFKITDADHDADVKAGKVGRDDWDNYLYLYFVLDRNEELGVYEAYAQVVDADDVDALIYADIPKELADLYPDLMDTDVNGESPYDKQVRHSGTGGFTSEE
jgi:hypothetical protein